MAKPRGFIALISAIIISAILLLVVVTGGLTGIFARGDALDAELKTRSVGAADACADQALLTLASGASPAGATYRLNSLDACRVVSSVSAGGTYTLGIQATSSGAAVTNLVLTVRASDLKTLSWQEVAHL